jgi:hypothetical protein
MPKLAVDNVWSGGKICVCAEAPKQERNVEELTNFEKLIEAVGQMAAVVAQYHKALLEQGLSESDALLLTTEYQKELLNMAKKGVS